MHWLTVLAALLGLPSFAMASQGEGLDPAPWLGLPFALLLLAIAVLPLLASRFWHPHRHKALVVLVLAVPVAGYLLCAGPDMELDGCCCNATFLGVNIPAWLQPTLARAGTQALLRGLAEYASFITLLASLYTVSGGIALRGDLQATPWRNAAFLATGAVLANVIGTTGASMLLIRPVLQVNRQRRHTRHLPVFFIFVVGNLGGLLTPLGDPPLFLGFLNGVDFLWTFSLWPQWLVANGIVLTVFFAWDTLAYRRESAEALAHDRAEIEPLRLHGLVNLFFLAGIVVAAVLQSEHVSRVLSSWLTPIYPDLRLHLSQKASIAIMVLMATGSLLTTPRGVRQANGFSWGAITEVAILFAGIFVTMVPALAWLGRHGPSLGITASWEFFWLSGSLSSFLDNAPTYVTFASLAAGGSDFSALTETQPLILQAISCGSVCMGANTYIGNGPNFMVKAIAEEAGYHTPSFFGYMGYAAVVLLPLFGLMTYLFFV